MKKFNIHVYDDCGCEKWVEAFIRELFERAKIKTEEVEYGTSYYDIARVWIFLSEYDGGKKRSNTLNLFDITKEDLEVFLAAVWNWHDTGEFKTAHFSCYPCSGPWTEN